MNIVKPNIDWRYELTPLNKSKIDGIALHHMACTNWDFWDVHNYHKNSKGWNGIGYNWWIAYDGTIYEGRGFNVGAGVGGHNSHLISIGFQGDYQNTKEMPKTQYVAGVQLIRWLRSQLPNLKRIDGHKYWNKTSCPGQYFPLKQMIEDGWENEVEEMRFAKLKNVPEGEFHTVIKNLIERGIIKGISASKDIEETEVDMSYDMLRLLVINYRAGLYD